MTTENMENVEAKADETTTQAEVETEQVEDNVEVLDAEKKEEVKEEEDFKAKFYYLAAEMENLRKRNERETQNLLKYGNEKILSSLLDVVDNLDRTLQAIVNDEDEKVKNIAVGINMVSTQMAEVLKNNGLEEIESLGKVFDPNFHEALAQQPAEGKADEEIISEYQKGYILNGRVVRAAKVVIVKN
jgi:molecular chaperone GrpE